MRQKTKVPKDSFSMRIPPALNQKLQDRAEEMGISKSALIMFLIYKEFGEPSFSSENSIVKHDDSK